MRRIPFLFALLLLAAAAGAAELAPDRWLRLDAPATPLPAFSAEDADPAELEPALDPATLDGAAALDGWRRVANDARLDGDAPVWLAARLASDRWLEPSLRIDSAHPVQAWLDGAPVTLAEKDGARTADLEFGPGDHLLLLRSRRDGDVREERRVAATLTWEGDSHALAADPDPDRPVDIHDVLDAPRIDAAHISPEGDLVALLLSEHGRDGKRRRWFEIRDAWNGDLERTWRGAGVPAAVAWHPDGHALSYTETVDGKTTLWLHDLKSHETVAVLHGVEHFGTYAWNPDGRSVVWSFSEEEESDSPLKRLRAIEDRWPWWRTTSFLMETAWPDGRSRRLTAGEVTATGFEFDAEGRHLILSRSWPDPQHRPYARTEWYELDLRTLRTERILAREEYWISSVLYGSDRNTLFVVGSPSAFDGVGRALPADVQPNDYGGQLFRYDRRSGDVTPLSVDFDPTIQGLVWHEPSKRLVGQVLDTQYVRLATCTYDGDWTLRNAGVDVVSGWEIADRANTVVAFGTGAVAPQRLHALDVKSGKPRLLLDPGAERYRNVTFGEVRPFVAELDGGGELDGRVYYPRNYRPGRKYPVIVYYYGGTSPITRDFGGRYPKNIWAGHDYFVYVPNPSGALGYGQEYAARHVNDWGRLTAPEVIAGTRAFLAAHADADADKVGCIGASYGGFLTMYLITQTDLFSAAISHAGISSISSYWAEGYWGYGYGARALAHSFPWNERDLYVEQSPLFHADAVTTPLLLLHGFDDTNVPKGESDGFYIALKMLGKDVEYVQVAGQDHHILDHRKRILWNDTILAYFDWKLKDRPQWWEALEPEQD